MSSHLPPNPNLNVEFNEDDLMDIFLAGGCFWGVEAYMARIPGVCVTSVGYANGHTDNPTYKEVCTGQTGHTEAMHLRYHPDRVELSTLLEEFFSIIDPTSLNRQGGDSGTQYRTGIYYVNAIDLPVIEKAVAHEQMKYEKEIVTEVEPLENFYLAEEYHQQYLDKNPGGYCHVSFEGLNK